MKYILEEKELEAIKNKSYYEGYGNGRKSVMDNLEMAIKSHCLDEVVITIGDGKEMDVLSKVASIMNELRVLKINRGLVCKK